MEELELTILMPCLNEEETIEKCINKAKMFIEKNKISAEILISDNGSKDRSKEIAQNLGARVIDVKMRGYGNALIAGTKAAKGKYVIMGDSDDSYDFVNLMPFLEKLREGYDLVMGNRFKGGIEKGAMPFSHRYIGNPILSAIGRISCKSKIGDFHCGLRGYNRVSILNLNLEAPGMEYASEMVVKAELQKLKVTEVPTTLKKDGRSRKPNLRTIRDGWRHLKYLMMSSPNCLFLYPGLAFIILGILFSTISSIGDFNITKDVTIGIHTMLYCGAMIMIGFELLIFAIMAQQISVISNLRKAEEKFIKEIIDIPLKRKLIFSTFIIILGIILTVNSFITWKHTGFHELNPNKVMPEVIASVDCIVIGLQMFFSSFIISFLRKLEEKNK